MVGAVRYSHRWCRLPLTNAGAIERAGFIDAPEIGPANIASKATTAPIAAPAIIPFSFAPVETPKITNINMNVRMISNTQACHHEPAGNVAPRLSWSANSNRRIALAMNAPTNWLMIYGSTNRTSSRRASQKPIVTAGLMCAPDTSPIAY